VAIEVGNRVPSAVFKWMGPDSPLDVRTSTSEEIFEGKTVAVFGLPGAYTPVCSEQHLPSFAKHADDLLAKGIDTIVCISANDPFVLQAWAQEHGAGSSVMMLTDPGAGFAKSIGLGLDLSDFGLGDRSERYSMIVKDGVVTVLNIEESILACEASSADALIGAV